jgi:hypothetical protein
LPLPQRQASMPSRKIKQLLPRLPTLPATCQA